MKILFELGRLIRFINETIVFGPFYSRFLYNARNTKPLDAEEAWNHIAVPKASFIEWFINSYPPKIFRWVFLRFYYRRSRRFKNHAIAITRHYDLSSEFYRLFLDNKYRFYSCADFLRSDDTLEDAQENKATYILNLIDPKPGQRILDLGCGWGGMLKKIYDKTRDMENLYGYTLSRDEKALIDQQYGFHCELKDFINEEYEQKPFDKIVTIEGLEHSRQREMLPLYKKLFNALKADGRLIVQLICQTEDVYPTRLIVGGFHIFPGNELTSFKKHLNAFEQANFKITHLSVHDFRPTIRAWFDRLAANREPALRLIGVNNYNKYLCYFAGSWRLFNDRDLMLVRLVLERRDPQL